MTYVEKIQVYLPKEELDALRKAASRSGRSVAELVRGAIRAAGLRTPTAGPVAIWDGEPRRPSVEHDTVHDEP
ncbi:MAG: CopG family transcriptional regulator [Burkholderiaceae bacterium]|nr:CopG family transcriptional regulator [Burkholderiaceae bacterium]